MDSFLSHDGAGLLIALVVAGLAFALVKWARRRPAGWARRIATGLGAVALVLGFVLVAGSGYHLYLLTRRLPPPGKLYDVGGYRMHLEVAGENRPTENGGRSPTLIWIPGGYGQGSALHHLHAAMAKETRSILYDRAGTGWSDRGPWPRSLASDVRELSRLLDAAGERGPFVLVGHSWGGLLSVNYAAAHRDQVAGLVLLEATPAVNLTSPTGAEGMRQYAGTLRFQSELKLFGLDGILASLNSLERNPEYRRVVGLMKKQLADVWDAMERNEVRSSSGIASASSFESLATHPSEQVTEPGALGDVPLFSIIRSDVAGNPDEMKAQLMEANDLTEAQWSDYAATMKKMADEMQVQVAGFSRRGQRFMPPAGTSHNFPYEDPAYVLGMVRTMLAQAAGSDSVVAGNAR